MNYPAFVMECQKKQRAYIRNERKRMAKAEKLNRRYVAAMSAIGFHPLNRMEIADRQSQLDAMESGVPDTHGDSPAMRAAYSMHFGESAT